MVTTGRGIAVTALALTAAAVLGALGLLAWHLHGGDSDERLMAATVGRYCVDCHNEIDLAGNLELDPDRVGDVAADPELWELPRLHPQRFAPYGGSTTRLRS